MTQFEFTPSKDYESLLHQANAMSMLIRAMEKQKSFQNIKIGDLARELALQGYEEINAQRTTNEILTDGIDALEKKLTMYKNALELIAQDKAEWDNATHEEQLSGVRLIAKIALEK